MKWSLLLVLLVPWASSCKERGTSHIAFDREKAALKAATLPERPMTIHSKPTISDDIGGPWLEASEGDTSFIERWGGEEQSPPVELDPNRIYQFDLLEQPYVGDPNINEGEEFQWLASLVRIIDSGQVNYDASICSLHEIPMKREVIPIQYGLPLYPEGFHTARKTKFPNASPLMEGGCCMGPDRTTHVFRCEQCIQEQQAWEAARPQAR